MQAPTKERQAYLLSDVHNFGMHSDTTNDPRYEEALAYLRSGEST